MTQGRLDSAPLASLGYYADKLDALRDVFGSSEIALSASQLRVGARNYPIVDDVIVLLPPERWPEGLRRRMGASTPALGTPSETFAEDIQFTFGREWEEFGTILPEHRSEFESYFDLVRLADLERLRVCDLGCGMGRWSRFLAPHCRELVLVDFSEAIFVARKNLRAHPNTLFFMGDLRELPFRPHFAHLVVCLGVLHHLPTPALQEVRRLSSHAPRLLVYLYYALDNRPRHFRWLLRTVTAVRKAVSRVKGRRFRWAFSWLVTLAIYAPLVLLGRAFSWVGRGRWVPLYEGYRGKSLARIRQDAYDRFFTRIEQRVTRKEILELSDAFREIRLSDRLPYWHFLAIR